ncbi:MAG: hypothetical protein E6J67_22750 [Deltaproteobacteria bacterium]|nr:MAG: hypothetical protein E6J67_22750 [Deltaproteobacteria bacterium]
MTRKRLTPAVSKHESCAAGMLARYGLPATAASSVSCRSAADVACAVAATWPMVGLLPCAQVISTSWPLRNVSPADAATVTWVGSNAFTCQACPVHGDEGEQPAMVLLGVPAQ